MTPAMTPATTSAAESTRPWRALALSLLGLVAITWLRVALAGTLKVSGTDTRAGLIAMGVLWLAFGAWGARTYLGAAAGPPPPLRKLLWGALLVHAVSSFALPYASNDLFSNLAYGRMMRLGLNPYLAGPGALPPGDPFLALVDARWRDTPMVYGPVVAAVDWLAARAGSVTSAMVVYKLVMLAVVLATVLVAYAICRRQPDEQAGASAFVFFALNPLLAWELSGQAHNDALMVLGLALFVWAALQERELLAVASLGFAVYAKFAVALVLGLYLVYLLLRSPAKAVALGLFSAALGLVVYLPFWSGSRTLFGPLGALSAGDANRVTHSYADLLCLLAELFGETARLWTYRISWALGMVLLGALVLRALARARTVEAVLHESLVCFFFYALVAAPWFLSWYESWMLPLALVDRDARWRRLVGLYTALSVVQWCVNLPALQAGLINTVVLVLFARWFFRAPAAGPDALGPAER
jgi:hypothetical protein